MEDLKFLDSSLNLDLKEPLSPGLKTTCFQFIALFFCYVKLGACAHSISSFQTFIHF